MKRLLLCLLPMLALAHGGEDHGDKSAAPIAARDGLVSAATGSVFEVVLKAAEVSPGSDALVRVMVSDVETNAPIQEASVEVVMKSASARLFSGKATATRTAGVYEFSARFPAVGVYSFDLTLQAKGRADLLALSNFEVPAPITPDSAAQPTIPLFVGGGVALFFIALLLGFILGRRRQPEPPSSEET